MEYYTVPSGPQPQQVPQDGLPPLNLATADNYYGRKAFDYDLNRDDCEKWKTEYTAIQEALNGFSGTLLDIPCGTGRFFPIYRERGIRFVGMDKSQDMLHQAHAKDQSAQLHQCDIAKGIPIANKGVDITLCSQFLKFLPDNELAAAIAEIARVTRHGILCSLFTSDQPTHRGGTRKWVHQLTAFNGMVEASGFCIKASAPIDTTKGHHIWMCEVA